MGLFFAWAIGEGIIIYRWWKVKAPPPPGELLLASGLFLALAVIAEYQPARTAATAFAYAVDLAVALQIIGKNPEPKSTGWPPALINNPSVILPTGSANAAASNQLGPLGAAINSGVQAAVKGSQPAKTG